MEITITARHMEVTEAMKDHARKRIEKLPRFYDRIQKVQLTMSVEQKNRQIAELVVSVPHGNDIVVSETAEDMYSALDLMMSRTERQLRKHKEKLKEHPRGKKPIAEAAEGEEE